MKNEEVINLLIKEFNENINSHVFLVETDDLEKSLNDIKTIIKNIISPNDKVIQNQIDTENYLELSIIRPDGKDIKKDQILLLQDRLKTAPILSKYMFYIIIPAESMNEIAANKMLKTIEEPNANIVGFLITQNSDILLPTIKSRCETIKLIYTSEENVSYDTELLDIVDTLIDALINKDHIKFYKAKSSNILKDNYKTVANLIKDYYNTACLLKSDTNLREKTVSLIKSSIKYDKLIKMAKYLNKKMNNLTKNMNGDLLLESIYFELKGELWCM